jgi:general nucleoside transport system permease protein
VSAPGRAMVGTRPPARRRLPGVQWRHVRTVGLYMASVAVAFLLSALLVQLTGHSPSSAFTAMYQGSLQDGTSLAVTIDETVPLLVVALGTIICNRAGIFNIGQEGQLIFGAMIGAAVGLKAPGPGWLVMILTLLASALGGAFWAGISALLKYWRRVDVVISTLLLTFVAFQVVSYAVTNPSLLRETKVGGSITASESNMLAPDVQLPRLGTPPDFNLSLGFFLSIALAVLVVFVIKRTRWGFRLRLLGHNPAVAHRAGVSGWRMGTTALLLGGAFAGLAGGIMLTGQVFRIQAGFSNNVGYQGLLVALVAQGNALVAVPVAFFFGALRSGGGFLASTGVPRDFVNVAEGLIVLAAVFPPAFQMLRRRRRLTQAPEPVAPATGEAAA